MGQERGTKPRLRRHPSRRKRAENPRIAARQSPRGNRRGQSQGLALARWISTGPSETVLFNLYDEVALNVVLGKSRSGQGSLPLFAPGSPACSFCGGNAVTFQVTGEVLYERKYFIDDAADRTRVAQRWRGAAAAE
jgi:hypothetical protein